MEVLGSVKNAFEHTWHKVSYNGITGYTSEDNLTLVGRGAQSISCTVTSPAEGATVPKAAYPVKGTVTSKYPLQEVVAEIDGKKYATVTLGKVSTLDLRSSDINYLLDFSKLSSGSHTLVIKARDIYRSSLVTVCTRKFTTEGSAGCSHSYSSTIKKAATCTASGTKTYTCSKCGDSYSETILALGHNYVDGICSRCGDWDGSVLSGACGNNAYWELSDGTLTIYGTGDMYNYSSMEAPWYSYWEAIERVVIEEGITAIGACSFWQCQNVSEVTMPNSILVIRDYAFYLCASLTSITLPDSIQSICQGVFEYCYNLGSITIPANVTYIGDNAFANCLCMTSMIFRGDVPVIGENAFYEIPAQVEYPMYNPTWETFTYQKYGGHISWIGYAHFVDSGTFENGVEWRLDDTGVLIITGDGEMPDFQYISEAPWYSYRKDINRIVIEDGVTKIGRYAFYECTAEEVAIADSVTTISNFAFAECRWLRGIEIPDGVTAVANGTFMYCESLEYVTIPDGVTRIGDYAFYYCPCLYTVTIPDGVTYVGEEAFTYCWGLEDITFMGDAPTFGDLVFAGVAATVYYPNRSSWTSSVMQNYGGTLTWEMQRIIYDWGSCGENVYWEFENNGVLRIWGSGPMWDFDLDENLPVWYAYGYGPEIEQVNIESGVTSIGDAAFSYCDTLKSVTIPNTVTDIGNSAFYCCEGLTQLTIPEGVTLIDDCAFAGCIGVSEIDFLGSAPTFSANCFAEVTTIAYYPDGNATWTSDVMKGYGGNIAWATEHSYTSKVTAPTCTAQGYTTFTCQTCGDSYKGNYTNATGHSYSYKATKNPTTSASGTLTGTCSKCSGTTTVTLPKLTTTDYTYKVTKAATCTATGTGRYTWKTTTYGSFYFDVTIAQKEHELGDWEVYYFPDCTQEGEERRYCKNCQYIISRAIEPTGHDYQDGICANCGATDPSHESEKPDYNGLVEINGTWGYYIDGVFQVDYSGFVLEDGIYYYVENGILDREFYGLVYIEGYWRYVEQGYVTWQYQGLAEYNGEYFYVEQSMVKWDYTGFVLHNGIYYYVQNGHLDWSFYGLVYIEGYWRYVEQGQVTWQYKGLAEYNGEYFYVEQSMVKWDYTGLVEHNGTYYYIQNGHLDWSYWGLAFVDGYWRYIENGMITWNYTGLAQMNGEYFYVVDSTLDWEYIGLIEHAGQLYYIHSGHLDWSYIGLGYSEGRWLYIYGGMYKEGYDGVVLFNDAWFYVEDSVLTWDLFGLYEFEGKLYYLNYSQIDWAYTGKASYNGIEYDVVGGLAVL